MQRSLILALCILCGSVWAADPVLGTWKLNLDKSTYIPGPAPRSQLRTYEARSGGVVVTIKTVDADGVASTVEHPLNYDGKTYPVKGATETDGIRLEKVDDHTSEAVLRHAAKIIGRNRRTVSQDGKTLTIDYEGTDNRRRKVKNTAVYEKQ